jgi:hypothetical protein
MTTAPDLGRLQQWMALVMRHPATADVAVRARPARALFPLREVEAGRVVVANERMSVTDRLQVYNGGYLARLRDVLVSDYPALQHLLGEDRFHRLCAAYVDAHPSRHPNLNQLGKQLPAFVRRQRDLPRRAFAAELAQLELGISLAFDAPEFTAVAPARLQQVPPGDWPRARLTCNPSLQLYAFRHPVNAWFIAFKADRAPRPPRPRASHVAVFRKDWRVWRLDLEPAAFAVLASIRRGAPLGRALATARGEAAVGGWFRTWAADGLFTDVRVPPR